MGASAVINGLRLELCRLVTLTGALTIIKRKIVRALDSFEFLQNPREETFGSVQSKGKESHILLQESVQFILSQVSTNIRVMGCCFRF